MNWFETDSKRFFLLKADSHGAICSNNLQDLHVVTTSFLWLNWLRVVWFLRSLDAILAVCYKLLLQIASCELALKALILTSVKFLLNSKAQRSILGQDKPRYEPRNLVIVHKFVSFSDKNQKISKFWHSKILPLVSSVIYRRVATDLENLGKSGNLKETSESQGKFAREFQKSWKSQGILLSKIHFQPSWRS